MEINYYGLARETFESILVPEKPITLRQREGTCAPD